MGIEAAEDEVERGNIAKMSRDQQLSTLESDGAIWIRV
jgi:hypothetical protein